MTLTEGEKKKRAVKGLFRAELRGENRTKHLNLDYSRAKQLAPGLLADSTRLDICSHLCHWLLCGVHWFVLGLHRKCLLDYMQLKIPSLNGIYRFINM